METEYPAAHQESVDVVIIGTDLVNCIVAAALAHAGVSVLHVDTQKSYGGNQCRTLSGREFMEWSMEKKNDGANIKISGDVAVFAEKGFEIDFHPSSLLSNGSVVRLLAESGVCRYLEFKLLSNTFILDTINLNHDTQTGNNVDGKWTRVPFTKEDVFTDGNISLVQKRRLMKALTCILDESQAETDLNDVSLLDYLKVKGINDDSILNLLIHAILHYPHSIQYSINDLTAKDGLLAMKTYFSSIGKYGSSPYLIPLYGTSELCQAFSRVSAIFGAVHVLGEEHVKSMDIHDKKVTLKMSESSEITYVSDYVLSSSFHLPSTLKKVMSRAVCILSQPLKFRCAVSSGVGLEKEDDEDNNFERRNESTLMILPPLTNDNQYLAYALQLCSETFHAPSSRYLLHIWTLTDLGTSEEREIMMDRLIRTVLGDVETISTVYFEQAVNENVDITKQLGPGLFVTDCEPILSVITPDNIVDDAKYLFEKIYGGIFEKKAAIKGWKERAEFKYRLNDPELEQELLSLNRMKP